MKQQTIQKAISLAGKGLHLGQEISILLQPAEANSGIQFRRVDLPTQPIVRADAQFVSQTQRSTTLTKGEAVVTTVEHILAACAGLGVDNLLIDINGGEVPILDGSAMPFVRALQAAGLVEQESPRTVFKLEQPITVRYEDSEITIMPADALEITTLIDFNSKILGQQFAYMRNLADFESQIAPARTFVFLHEIQPLLNKGLIKGGDIDNAVVFVENVPTEEELQQLAEQIGKPYMRVEREGILNLTALHFSNEPARHKLLDLLGDISLSGVQLCARIVAHKPGHTINTMAAKAIKQAYKEHCKSVEIPKYDPTKKPIYDINDISQRLQHRYPFLLLDKIIELTDTYIVGVKNVTMNEPFFMGHFPNNPVMPGVLQIEAMAQTGGLFVFKVAGVENPLEWDTYFLRINNAKFRDKVIPGDILIFKLELMSPIRRGLCEMRAKAFVGNKIVAEAELLAQIIQRK